MKDFEEYFDVVLNPFTKDIKLIHYVSKEECYEKELIYNEIDEWQSFTTFNDRIFDIHIYYNEEMYVSIYEIDPNLKEQNYTDSMKVNLTIKLNEK